MIAINPNLFMCPYFWGWMTLIHLQMLSLSQGNDSPGGWTTQQNMSKSYWHPISQKGRTKTQKCEINTWFSTNVLETGAKHSMEFYSDVSDCLASWGSMPTRPHCPTHKKQGWILKGCHSYEEKLRNRAAIFPHFHHMTPTQRMPYDLPEIHQHYHIDLPT